MATIPGIVKESSRKTPFPGRRSAEEDRLSPVAALVRRHDRDRFQTVLFAPAARREALFALYAFNYEIARVRETVTQPMLGQMRLQWWREAIAAAFEGGPIRHHPVVEPLSAAIREFAPTRDHFEHMIEARESDFEAEPPPTLSALEDYTEETSARIVYVALEFLGVSNPSSGEAGHHVGIAYALAGILRALPFYARAGRRVIPADLAGRTGLAEQDYFALRNTPALRAAAGEIAAVASHHLELGRGLRRRIPRVALPALLPAVIAHRSLTRLKKAGYDAFDRTLGTPDPLQSWRLAMAALLRQY
ncbi:MAG: phytoene/squalene synthase family protein [Stellaceae bacterium]